MDSGSTAILVVDDDAHVLKVVTTFLHQEGYTTHTTADGQAALDLLKKKSFDLVLSDIKMPQLDGFQLLQQVREQFPEVGVVLMTGFIGEYTARNSISMGARGHLFKPFSYTTLSTAISSALQGDIVENSP